MGWLFGRRSRLPAGRRPPLERDERVLAWAVTHTTAADPVAGPGVPADLGLADDAGSVGGPGPAAGSGVPADLGRVDDTGPVGGPGPAAGSGVPADLGLADDAGPVGGPGGAPGRAGDAGSGERPRIGEAEDSGTIVVTNRGLWLPDERGRLGWHHIHKAVWSGRVLTITPAEVVVERSGYAVVADRPVRSYLLLEPGDVPHQVRTRVTNSVAYSEHHPMPGGGGARLAARRVSGVDGLTWTVRLDPDTDRDAPAVLAALDQLVTHARRSTTPEP